MVKTDVQPTLTNSFGAVERWDGNFGAGPLNALEMTKRGIEVAKKNGIACIALKNSNHWMRPGYFGWYAANEGFILICWTNTIPNLPPWGAKEARTGNNPFVIAVPRKKGNIVLDVAVSQFSYGKMYNLRRKGKKLPLPGGFDKDGNMTDDPGKIIESERPFPIGYWKGAGLSLMFDITASLLSGGRTTKDLSEVEGEMGPSQIFIVINPEIFSDADENENKIDEILSYFKSAEKINEETEIFYPGERVLKNKIRNMEEGIELDEELINKVREV